MITLLALLYMLCAVSLVLLSINDFILTILTLWQRLQPHKSPPLPPLTTFPQVTVQLPIYNERFVVERLLEAVCALDYPRERLVIQLLDDSTDETSRIAARCIERLQAQGCPVVHVRRTNRSGYKAGALVYGMQLHPAEFYAIFDADFIPAPDFLKRTLPHLLENPQLGMVQGSWGHLNRQENAVTAAQALAIDAHFLVEQGARSRAGLLHNFNGTGGVWRATCIESAGGWRDLTLTEDFDLSYRAQMAGWKLRTLPDLVVPGEVPATLSAFRQQQYRWAFGSTQVLRLMLGKVWRQPHFSLGQRLMATWQLCQYMPYLLLVLLPLMAPPLLYHNLMDNLPLRFMLFSGMVPLLMYTVSQALQGWRSLGNLSAFPALTVYGTGIALSNSAAIISALLGSAMPFVRTPKAGAQSATSAYRLPKSWLPYLEIFMMLYVLWGFDLALVHFPPMAPYLMLSAFSYGFSGFAELFEALRAAQPQAKTTSAYGD